MRESGIEAQGIDVDETMIQYCLSRGLKVKNIDAISYLNSLDDESLDGVFTDQVVEHLDPAYLAKMLKLCHRKMKAGAHIFIETVNPTSFTSFVNFYIDMTHQRPIHPQTLAYLVEAAAFSLIEVKFLAPVKDGLKKIKASASLSDDERETVSTYNENIDVLNHMLFGEQDYYVLGRK
jgi:O-antigen chain-terminating methyltransferase